jgi:peptidoglycan L-alanyl-D-glutamate endopeptidase CwlK
MTRDPLELDPDVRALWFLLRDAALEKGIDLFLTGTYRTIEEQDALYAQGRKNPGRKVTNARGGWSWHNWRRAFDVAIRSFPGDATPDDVYDGPWAVVGALGEAIGLEWGGRWKSPDLPHMQLTRNLTLTQMQSRGPIA